MLSPANLMASSSRRPVPLKMRKDLSIQRQRYHHCDYWIVKEPIALDYSRFQEEEFAILQMLDGSTSLEEIRSRFEQQFAPQRVSLDGLQQFIGTLHRKGLVTSSAAGQGLQLKTQHDERKRRQIKEKLTNVLAIRFRGIDPDAFLNRIYPLTAWLFSTFMVLAILASAVIALCFIALHFNELQSKLPAFHEFMAPQNWLTLGIVMALTKILHELGHGLACKHFRGECHGLGVMLLVFTPCLYCDVSDSWLLPNKWHRAAIAAAGIYIEIILALAATFLWWHSQPGPFNFFCLQIMFVCSVSTLVFNGNPLMRYDGYYVLSDLIEIPNLRQKASAILNNWLCRVCLGMKLPQDPFMPKRNRVLFASFAIASTCYQWFVTISILFFMCKVLEPYGLEVLGKSYAVFMLGTILVMPLVKLRKFLLAPGRIEKMKYKNVWATSGVGAAVIAGAFTIPLPHYVFATFELKPDAATSVYVERGRLEHLHVQPGDQVEKGNPIATLADTDIDLALAQLEQEIKEQRVKIQSLKRMRFVSRSDGEAIAQSEQTLLGLEDQLEQRQQEKDRLTIRAPRMGIIYPASWKAATPATAGQLPTWSGWLLEPRNLGTVINEGAVLCQIGDRSKYSAELVIDQADIEFVRKGQPVSLMLNSFTRSTMTSEITTVAQEQLREAPASLSLNSGGELVTKTDRSGVARPLSTTFSAEAPILDEESLLQVGLRGRAKIYVGRSTLAERAWRLLGKTFRFDL